MIQEIKKYVYAKGKGEMDDKSRIGSIYYNRGVVHGIVTVEAIRKAQEKFGKKPLTGEQMRWGIENLQHQRSAVEGTRRGGLHAAAQGTCADHEGGGAVKFQQWDGNQWKVITDWIQPDSELVRGDGRRIRGGVRQGKEASRRAIAARKPEPPPAPSWRARSIGVRTRPSAIPPSTMAMSAAQP